MSVTPKRNMVRTYRDDVRRHPLHDILLGACVELFLCDNNAGILGWRRALVPNDQWRRISHGLSMAWTDRPQDAALTACEPGP